MALYRRSCNFVSSYLYMLNSGLRNHLIVLAILLCLWVLMSLFSSIGLSDNRILPLLLAKCLSISIWLSEVFHIERVKRFGCFRHSETIEADNDGKLALTVFTFHVALLLEACLVAWRFSLGVLQMDLVLIYTGLFSVTKCGDLWSIFIFLSSSGTMKWF